MTGQGVTNAAAQCGLDPWMAFGGRFSFDKDRAKMALVRETLDRGLVDRLLFRLQESENLRGERGRHPLENFVRFHVSAKRSTSVNASIPQRSR